MAASIALPNSSPYKTGGSSFNILEDEADSSRGSPADPRPSIGPPMLPKHNTSTEAVPLVTSKLVNAQSTPTSKKQKTDHKNAEHESETRKSSMDSLLDKLNKQQMAYKERKISSQSAKNTDPSTATTDATLSGTASASGSSASDHIDDTPVARKPTPNMQSPTEYNEMLRLKKELDAAKDKIARQERELHESRSKKQPGPSQNQTYISNMQDAFNAQRGGQHAGQQWVHGDDARSDISDALSAGSIPPGQYRGFSQNVGGFGSIGGFGNSLPAQGVWGQVPQRPLANRPMPPNLAPLMVPQAGMRQFATQPSPMSAESFSSASGFSYGRGRGGRGGMNPPSAGTGSFGTVTSDEMTPMSMIGVNNPMHSPMGSFQAPIATYQPRPIGAPLSATAAEFDASGAAQWESRSSSPGQTFIPTTEPLNYRRLLDKSVSCNWKYIVDKIVHNNDQQASIFLQQKLKVGTAEQKYDIVESIVAHAYPLMVNRFGNFLVQRCFEHGTPEQVVAIAHAIRGNTLSLSMDPFGCHVVQKAFDAVPEEYKAIMVHELLRRIPETVIHRYACHVWQKLFELRWSDSPPQIMKYVNDALAGMWHEVALGETGSLVVQNIFENCLEEDKRPCIEEVLNSIDVVAHGQFGNWCIQHICEHGAPADRTRAIDHVLKYATEYSMDQFASKVVEKCLKIGGSEFLERYLNRVCEGRPDRPRIPLIDIASDQYGNYLIQYILTHASTQHRELVASHIRKHMVSLRGSKFGSRVGMLCSNPAYATRPGPGIGAQTQRYIPGQNFSGQAAPTSSAGFNTAPGFATNGPISGGGNGRFSGSFH